MLKTCKENSIFKGSKYKVMLPFRPHFDFMHDNYILAEKKFKISSRTLNRRFELTF